MSDLDFIFAFVLAGAGCFLLAVVLHPILNTLWISVAGRAQSGRIRKAAQKMESIDALIQEKNYRQALTQLEQAVVFDTPGSVPSAIALKEHYQNILSRCMLIAEEQSGHISNIAIIEQLIFERGELVQLFAKAAESFQRLSNKRGGSGKSLPSWTTAEYQERIKTIQEQLSENHKLLFSSLEKMFAELKTNRSDEILYH